MKQFFKQYIPYYKDYKKKFFYAVIGMIMVAAGTSGTAYVIKPVLDDIFVNKNKELLYLLPFAIVLLYSLKGFGRYLQTYYIVYIGSDIIRRVRNKFLAHILIQDLKFFHNRHGGELLSRIGSDIGAIQGAVSSTIATIIMEALTIFSLLFVVIYQSPKLAFFSLVILPLIFYPLSKLAKKMKKLAKRTQEKNATITSILSETFNNIEMIIANNSQAVKQDTFYTESKNVFDIYMKGVKTNALVSPLMEITGSIAAAIVVIIGGMEVIEGTMTVGTFFSFITALFMLYTPIKKISSVYNTFQVALAANDRINEIFNSTNDITEGKLELNEYINQVKFNDVSLKYDDKIALKNINLTAKRGEKIALVGDSGGGKSSFVNLILRFFDPYEGKVVFNDHNINMFTFESLRNSVSIVTQRVYIFNETVAYNIAFGQEYNESRIIEVLKQAHAFGFVEKLEDGINTKLDEFGTNLSGGQRQRLAIARALYKNPQIIIFDEATSALDNESESIITQVLDEISKDKITFVIAHRLSTIKNADRIAVFKDGKIVCQDSEIELLKDCEEYKRLHMLAVI